MRPEKCSPGGCPPFDDEGDVVDVSIVVRVDVQRIGDQVFHSVHNTQEKRVFAPRSVSVEISGRIRRCIIWHVVGLRMAVPVGDHRAMRRGRKEHAVDRELVVGDFLVVFQERNG